MKKIFLIIFLMGFLYAKWDPAVCFPDKDLSCLKDPDFKKLKKGMISFLQQTWCTEEKGHLLMDLTYITKPERCVEIGVFNGSSLIPVASVLKYLRHGAILGIDAWSNQEAIRDMAPDDPNYFWWSTVSMEEAYQKLLRRLEERSLNDYCGVLRNTAMQAVKFVSDEIDFLHLDGNYSEQGVLYNVEMYLPKVKSGGYILMSNILFSIKDKAPRKTAYLELCNACDLVCEIEDSNAALFRKR